MENRRYGVIYKITNKITGQSYIGRTKYDFDTRYKGGEWWNETDNIHLWRSARKYGIENFYVIKEMDYAFSKEELYRKERFYIKVLETNNPKKGFNKTPGDYCNNGKDYRIAILDKKYNYIETVLSYEEIINKGYTPHQSAIINVCHGRRGASYGYIFYYEEDYIKMIERCIESKDFRGYLYNKYNKKK